MVIDVTRMKRIGQKDIQVGTSPAGLAVLFIGILCFAMLITPVSAASLATPVMISPVTNQQFFHFPRITTLACKPVAGATDYLFEVEYFDFQWNHYFQTTRPNPYYTFEYIGDNLGRWRVTAIDSTGHKSASKASAWWTFYYETGRATLGTPVPTSPVLKKANFYHNPRVTTVTWKPVAGANGYIVEVEYSNPMAGGWSAVPGTPAYLSGIYSSSYTFTFAGQTQGQWRVMAMDSTGTYVNSEWSAWRTFSFKA